ncbi:MoaD/ThiS family protein [Catellatospora tritici]|uniref:MoaD/ThiS family protein n=1 Tax=Catellatospora tritici TaxID=2851566 RepID=UPI001C2D8683|nr:MoaD/ThiS family protein [Catellatospora tritici]MBV1853528.1 MoaD/ThiS family protein [Catellatospora tritici]
MEVLVEIPTVFLSHTNGSKRVTAYGGTVAEVLADLDSRHQGIRSRVVNADGTLKRFVNVYVNEKDVRAADALNTQVADGDSILILPAVAGG